MSSKAGRYCVLSMWVNQNAIWVVCRGITGMHKNERMLHRAAQRARLLGTLRRASQCRLLLQSYYLALLVTRKCIWLAIVHRHERLFERYHQALTHPWLTVHRTQLERPNHGGPSRLHELWKTTPAAFSHLDRALL